MSGQIIKRNDESFTVRVFLGRDAAGKRRYLNKTVRGSKKEAQKVLTALLRNKDLGLVVEPNRLTVEAYLEHWLATAARPRLRARTFEAYQDMMVRYVNPVLGAQRLAQLTPVEVQALYGRLQERGLSARTVRYCHTVFSNALGQAVKWRLTAQNPAQYVDLPKQQKKEMRPIGNRGRPLSARSVREQTLRSFRHPDRDGIAPWGGVRFAVV